MTIELFVQSKLGYACLPALGIVTVSFVSIDTEFCLHRCLKIILNSRKSFMDGMNK